MNKLGLCFAVLATAASACGTDSLVQSTASSGTRARDAGSARDASSSSADEDEDEESGDDATPDKGVAVGATDGGKICSTFNIASGRVTPDMLIVLDRSSSMRGAGVNRWDPSVSGLKSITAALDDEVRFGLMAFPGRGAGTGWGGLSCAAGTLEVDLALNNASAIASRLDQLQLVETTPTAATLAEAHTILSQRAAPADTVALPPPYVVLVTDGAPNCTNGAGGRGGGDTAAVQASVAAIESMAQDGIKTYVLGYGTQSDTQLRSALDAMARAGATGDTAHRAIEDEATLIAAFRQITGSALTCDFSLAQAPSDPSYVLVTLSGARLAYDPANGWSLSQDHRTLRLNGSACETLQGASSDDRATLSVSVQCEVVQAI